MASREEDFGGGGGEHPFGPMPDDESAGGDGGDGEEEGMGLDEALAGLTDEDAAEAAAAPGAEEPSGDEGAGEEPSGGEEDGGRFRDPESGQFISAQEARDRGLEPEDLQTEEEAAEDFFPEEEEGGGEDDEETEEHAVLLGDEESGIELLVDDPEVAEEIEDLQERAGVAEETREELQRLRSMQSQIEEDRRELDDLERELREDPVPFMLDKMGEDIRSRVALDLLAMDEGVRDEVIELVDEWRANPHKMRADAAERARDLERRRRERTESRYQSREVEEAFQEIVGGLNRVAEQAPETRRDLLVEDLRNDIADYLVREGKDICTLREAAEIPKVKTRLRSHGIDPSALLQPSGNGHGGPRRAAGQNGREVVEAQPAGSQERDLAEDAEKYRKHGERLRKAHARRKDAASTTGSGAGAEAAGPEVPGDATLEDAFEIAERRLS